MCLPCNAKESFDYMDSNEKETKKSEFCHLYKFKHSNFSFTVLPSRHTSLIVYKRYIKVQSATTKNFSNTFKEGIN